MHHTLGPLDPVTWKEAAIFTVYTGPFDPRGAVVPLFLNMLLLHTWDLWTR